MLSAAVSPAHVIEIFSSAIHDGRVDDALALYEPDAVFIPQPGAAPLADRESIRAALQQFAALRPGLTAEIRGVVVAGDVATVVNNWQLRGTALDGSSVAMAGMSADVMRRRADGSWGILIDDPWAMSTT